MGGEKGAYLNIAFEWQWAGLESVPAPRGRYAQPQAPPEQSQYLVVDAVRAPGLIGEDVIGELVG